MHCQGKGKDSMITLGRRKREGLITYVIMGRKVMEYTDGEKYLEKPARERRKGLLLGGTSEDILPIYNMLLSNSGRYDYYIEFCPSYTHVLCLNGF